MLVLAHNPGAFRINTLRRSCTPIYLSRAALRERFGEKHGTAQDRSDSLELTTAAGGAAKAAMA
jgi:hypothetical protein